MADIYDFNKKTPAPEGPKPMNYEFELHGQNGDGPEKVSAFGLLSFGTFCSVIKDESTPIVMFPYERILAIRATPEIVVAGSA